MKSVSLHQPVKGTVLIRGEHFDDDKMIVVTLGTTKFTNVTDPPTLRVIGSNLLTLEADDRDLAKNKVLVVSQGTAGPKRIAIP